jgi:hypothetical protein
MSEQTLKRESVGDFLKSLNGKFFTVEFIKRTSGERRVMRATTNYESLLKGGEAKYNFDEKKLLPVRDLEAQAFRSIALDAVLVIRANGNIYNITD